MQRKHYEHTARKIRQRIGIARQMDETRSKAQRQAAVDTLAMLARDFADDFADDNPRFDRKRFMDACGLTEDARG